MTERHFIVRYRDAAWHYAYRGNITGPFGSRDEAIEAAIKEACDTGEPEAEVIVQDPDMRQETVWRHGG